MNALNVPILTRTHPMSAIPAHDHGVTDRLDPYLGTRLEALRDRIDERFGVRVDDTGITVRRLLSTRHTSWDRVERVTLDNRLDVLLAAATRILPVRRVPLVGGLLTDTVRGAAAHVTRRFLPGVRDHAGWVVASVHREGALRPDIDVEGGAWLTALLHPALSEAVQSHAAMRHIPIERR